MHNISDEQLMAYVDGELPPAERAEIEAAMKTDPLLESRMSVFLATRTGLAGLYDDAMRRPAPDHLIDLILRAPDEAERSQVSTSSWLDRIGVGGFLKNFSAVGNGYAAAFAFSLLLFTTGFAGWQLKSNNIPHVHGDAIASFDRGRMLAHGRLRTALDGVASGKKLTWSMGDASTSSIKPVFTFRTAAGSYCRQYEMSLSMGEGFSGVACRNKEGNWKINAHVAARPGQDTGNKMVPASGAASSAIDKVVDQLIEGDVLGTEEETLAITNEWKG